MKIVLVSNLFPNPAEPFRGMFNWHIANNLANDGNTVNVVSPLPFFPAIKQLQFMEKWYKFSQIPRCVVYEKVNAYYPKYLMIPKLSESAQSFLMFPFLYRSLKYIQQNWGVDVVNVHYLYPDGVAACRVCRMLKLPVVLSALGSDVNVLTQNTLIADQIRNALSRCSAITAVSQDLARKIEAFGLTNREIHVLHNGVDLSLFSLLDRKLEREKAGEPINGKIILYVGRLSPEKGIDCLFNVARMLKQRRINIKVVLIGEGADKKRLVDLGESLDVMDMIQFVGEQTPAEINRWLGMSDLLCLPSIREGCPNVVLEAFAAGRPVVGSNVGGIPELIGEYQNGLLFEPGNLLDLANKLDFALNYDWDPAVIRKTVMDRSWSSVAREYMGLYRCVSR